MEVQGQRTELNLGSVYFENYSNNKTYCVGRNTLMKVNACQNIRDVCFISTRNYHAMALTLLTSP